MDFRDLSKEARLKEEARFNQLERNVVNKATKMALDKFSKVYGVSTKVAAQKADLKEFKRNYLSGKIASVLSIDTKSGIKNVPFTILIKASEPTILESDQIIDEKVAATQGSLDDSINSVIKAQEQKLANLEAEQEANNKILADLAKGVSIEAARKAHIFKEAKKQKKQERNSLSTATTPTDFLGDVVEYFTYPKTFFPAMKVGAVVDIAGVKYKYIGDEATMTEPAGNTNGTIARFELANKKKASLNIKAEQEAEDVDTNSFEYIYSLYVNGNLTEFRQKIESWFPGQIDKFVYFLDYLEDNVGLSSEQVKSVILGKAMPEKKSAEQSDIEKKSADEGEQPKEQPKKRGFGGSTELTEEVLNSVIGHPPAGYTDTSVNKAIAEKSGREGATYLTALSRGRTLKRHNENATYRDLLESVTKGDWETRTEKSDEEKQEDADFAKEDAFFKDDAKVLEYINDPENSKKMKENWGDVEFIENRYDINNGLPDNEVNKNLVKMVSEEPRKALRVLEYLFPDDIMGNETQDNENIAESLKKTLFESAIKFRSYDRLKRWFPFADKYLDLHGIVENPEFNPISEEYGFIYDWVESFMRTRPSKEKFKEYIEKYNVLENIDKKIDEYQKVIDSLEESKNKPEENK